jgi:predicted nucleic acid-binding protein
MVYCDSNLLARLYADMPGSDAALKQFAGHRAAGGNPVPITWLHRIEIAHAFEQLVFFARAGVGGRMTPEQAGVALAQFDEDLASGRSFVAASISAAELVQEARQLSLRRTARHGFRTYDLVHVASALLLKCNAFWSFDAKASKLARLEGLKTL